MNSATTDQFSSQFSPANPSVESESAASAANPMPRCNHVPAPAIDRPVIEESNKYAIEEDWAYEKGLSKQE